MSEQQPSKEAMEAAHPFEYDDEEMDTRLALAFDAFAAAAVARREAEIVARLEGRATTEDITEERAANDGRYSHVREASLRGMAFREAVKIVRGNDV